MELTIALNRYDRHIPFFNGTVRPPKGHILKPSEVGESSTYRDGTDRHERMLKHLAFDIAEMSLSSYIIAMDRDPNLPLIGLPVFPRRFFSAGQIYVNAKAGIKSPKDLIGRKVGLHAFQVTLSVLAKGDLKLEYGVPWEKVHWFCMRPEMIPINLGHEVKIEIISRNKDIGTMLCEGEIDALISPQPRVSMLAQPDKYRRLFSDVHAEEVRYFQTFGFYPIMHLVVMKRELADKFPDLPRDLVHIFEDAKELAYSFYDDSNYSLLIDARTLLEQQRTEFGTDPWPNGLVSNVANLNQFIGYMYDQRLISAPFSAEKLFHPTTHET